MGNENRYVQSLRKWSIGFLISGTALLLLGISAILIPEIGYRPVFGLVSSFLGLAVLTHLLKIFVVSVIQSTNRSPKEKKANMAIASIKSLKYWSIGLFGAGVILFLAPSISFALNSSSLPFLDLAGVFGPSLMFLGLLAHLLKLSSAAIGETVSKNS